MARFDSILIANRGEIAARVIRTAKALGYRTVAVYSVADAGAPHVSLADEAVCIGGPEVGTSYLDPSKILDAAKATRAGAIHPGYGFLSENATFAKACGDAGLVFIGPSPEAIDVMGNKAGAKRRMIAAGVPCVPGYEGEDQSDETLIAEAKKIGFPIMVKAAAGGGGRGMRLVESDGELAAAIKTARSEAQNAFGSGELILEKAVQRPRHVEVQVFGDSHGHVIHLGERDCSVQRRHQKVVEEAPCPVMTPELRAAMGEAAVQAAHAVHYQGAGTVEFLLGSDGAFYFLEMNTRLQVEHPVTECITGLDLVALQIEVAQGAPLGLGQDDVTLSGHAIEVRLYAEDPANNFLPATGKVTLWRPASGEGVRIDHGLNEGQEISPFYDPMVAKVIAHGPNREVARQRLIAALEETGFMGPASNRNFLIRVLRNETFAKGGATTAFIGEEFAGGVIAGPEADAETAAIAAVLQYRAARDVSLARATVAIPELCEWQSAEPMASQYSYAAGEEALDADVLSVGRDTYKVTAGGEAFDVAVLAQDDSTARVRVGDAQRSVNYRVLADDEVALDVDGAELSFLNLFAQRASAAAAGGDGAVVSPMHGKLQDIMVAVGDTVEKGQTLAIVEAMKMEHSVKAPISGTVAQVGATAGDQVAANALLVQIDAA